MPRRLRQSDILDAYVAGALDFRTFTRVNDTNVEDAAREYLELLRRHLENAGEEGKWYPGRKGRR